MKRSARDRAALAQIRAHYATLPAVRCAGRCAVACGALPLTDLEARQLQAVSHVKPRTIPVTRADGSPSERCVYLTDRGRCSVYADRPLICRVWGVVKVLSCPFGCRPDRWLSDVEFLHLAQAVERLGGGRVVRTAPDGLTHTPGESYGRIRQERPTADIDADAERTLTLRAIHGGRIIRVVTTSRRT